ncbi:DUF2726 domain-containing protein [Sapientia aquatica]|uniref:DUF2726 domain-containing protein n=1 Tax=Sapientia aquatica TaxID=1549640 RepID=A0A4R5VRA4_9BURK|nr:DUF2726 domain-containing protein [Sapientia aquatica]TDK61205.1 DUF2726 domain-containing protein [Sapientia aquatica]
MTNLSYNPFGKGLSAELGPSGKKSKILSFKRQGGLLVNSEMQALQILSSFRPTSQYLIFPQVHLLQTFDVDQKKLDEEFKKRAVASPFKESIAEKVAKKWKFEMGWKSVDFLVCSTQNSRVLGGIEIDDPTHAEDPARQACDLVKNIIFASLDVPLLRFTNAQIAELHSEGFGSNHSASFSAYLQSATAAWDATKKILTD